MALIPLNTFRTKTAVLTTLKYNQAKCARDTSLIIDSIAFDLLQAGYTQTAFAGLQYWAQSSSKIPGEVFQTLSALEHAKQVSLKLVINATVTPTIGNAVSQVKDFANAGDSVGQSRISDEYNFIMDIIDNGTAGVTNQIESNGSLLTSSNLINTANLLYSNKAFLRAEVLAYINLTYNTFVYDKEKCARDTRLIVDSLANDLLFNGTTQSTFAGLQYWSQGATVIATEITQTLASLAYAKSIMGQIIRNISISASVDNQFTQYIDTSSIGSLSSKTVIDSLSDVITGIITLGKATVSDDIVPNGDETTEEGYLNSYYLLQNNKRFIQNEVVVWINAQIASAVSGIWYNFSYNSEKCYRDMGYIVDSICFDLRYGGNRQSIQAGVYYYGFSTTSSAIPTEVSEAISAYNYLKSIIGYVIESQALPAIYQTSVDQVLSIDAGTVIETNSVSTNIDLITTIINKGPSQITTTAPINLEKIIDDNSTNAAALLIANRDFLAAEITAYVDNNTSTAFVYDEFLCSRDVGYIVDSIVFDVKHGGNRQAAQSGVYYFNKSATISVVPTEKPDTISAYNYMRSVISKVIQGQEVTNIDNFPNAPFQSEVKQNITLPASTSTVASSASSLVTFLNTIINLGPSVTTSATRIPIGLTSSTNVDIVKAYNIIMANKPYITAEIIGYMDSFNTPTTIKIYTAPPGVTSIVLMAQVANVTDHPIEITYAHYRNLPIIADPATLNGYQAGDTLTEMVKDYTVPPNDSVSLVQGKMIIESFDSIVAYASESAGLKITMSILETANA